MGIEVAYRATVMLHRSAVEESYNAPDGSEDVLWGLDGAQAEEHIGAGRWDGRADDQGDLLGNGIRGKMGDIGQDVSPDGHIHTSGRCVGGRQL